MIRKVSKTRARQNAQYQRLKREWGKTPRICEYPGCYRLAEKHPHHSRGRVATLLCDVRFWKALCHCHHVYVHNNPEKARELGLICSIGLWNTPGKPED